MRGSLRKVVVLLLAAALGVGTASAATRPKPCKPKTAKKCKKPVAKRPAPKRPAPKKPAPTTTTTTTSAPAPADAVTLTMGAGMPEAQANAIRSGVAIAKQYFAKLGVPSTWHAAVYAEPTFDAIVADYAAATGSDGFARGQCPNGCAFTAHRDKVFIFPFGSSYYRPDELAGHTKTPVHELWHTVQYALAPRIDSIGADGLLLDGPTWLREGSADYVGYAALRDAGVDASMLRTNVLYDLHNNFAGVTLASTASGQGQTAAYSLGFLAVELLVEDTGSVHSLIDYWTTIGQGTEWTTAFRQVFGRTVEQFYGEFETYRRSL